MKTVQNDFGRGAVLVAQDPDPDQDDALSLGMIDKVLSKIPQKIAAQDDNGATGPDSAAASSEDNSQTPALAETLTEEEGTMDLNELMGKDPALKAQVEARDAENRKAGEKAGLEAMEARIKKAAPYLAGSEYPEAISALAVKVLKGEEEPAALTGAVTVFDAQKEQEAASDAQTEGGKQKETPPGGQSQVTEDGTVNNETDQQAAVGRLKAATGQEV